MYKPCRNCDRGTQLWLQMKESLFNLSHFQYWNVYGIGLAALGIDDEINTDSLKV